jgi:L-rhamnose mutarotase
MTERSAFVLRVRPDRIEAYVEAHGAVWPDMLQALRDAGIRNYSIFRDGNQVFGYFESDDLTRAAAYLAGQEVCTRWQDAMAELLEERVPDEGPPALEEIFRLDRDP